MTMHKRKTYTICKRKKLTVAYNEVSNMTQYSRIVTDSICDSYILSVIWEYFFISRELLTTNQQNKLVLWEVQIYACFRVKK